MNNYLTAYALTKLGFLNFKTHKKGEKLEKELIKYTDISRVKVIDLPEELYEPVDKTKIQDNQVYKDTVRIFGKKIQEVIPEEDLGNFYRNFSSIQMLELTVAQIFSRFLETGGTVGGQYNPKYNTIFFKDSFISSSIGAITHELLHAASSYYDRKRNVIYVGLSQMYLNLEDEKKTETYGLALNEGYTQYLNNKYFVDQNSMTLNIFDKRVTIDKENYLTKETVYKDEQIIAKALNAIVGEDKMQSFYFRGDLNGLVKELEKYQPRETIYRFINYTDVLCFYSGKINIENETVDEVKKFINSFLLSTFVKAQKSKGQESDEEFNYFLENCLPYENPKTHTVVISEEYLSGEVDNPLDIIINKKR